MLHLSEQCSHHIETGKLICIANEVYGLHLYDGCIGRKGVQISPYFIVHLQTIVTMLWELVSRYGRPPLNFLQPQNQIRFQVKKIK